MPRKQTKMYAETVGEFTEEHARRLMALSCRIWKRHLTEQAEQRRREQEVDNGSDTRPLSETNLEE